MASSENVIAPENSSFKRNSAGAVEEAQRHHHQQEQKQRLHDAGARLGYGTQMECRGDEGELRKRARGGPKQQEAQSGYRGGQGGSESLRDSGALGGSGTLGGSETLGDRGTLGASENLGARKTLGDNDSHRSSGTFGASETLEASESLGFLEYGLMGALALVTGCLPLLTRKCVG